MQQSHPILYSFVRCPYAIRARLALKTSQTTYELREVDLKNKPLEMLEASPKGTVPVLLLPDGNVIDESRHIMEWSLSEHDPMNLLRMNKEEKLQAAQLIEENDDSFKKALDRYKYPHRYPNEQDTDWKAEAEKFICKLERKLENTKYLITNEMTFVDLAVMPFTRQFSKVESEWFASSQYQQTYKWLTKIENSETFKAIMLKHKPWKSGDEITLIVP